MKRILLGVLTVGAVASVALFATGAFFSDTEKSTGNLLQAGKLDLLIDDECSYNGVAQTGCTWLEKDLSTGDLFFNYTDVKPGDSGENTISLKVVDNPAWVCASVQNLTNADNGLTEPESAVDSTDGIGNGELQDNIFMTIWRDSDCNNKLDGEIAGYCKTLPTGIPWSCESSDQVLCEQVHGDGFACEWVPTQAAEQILVNNTPIDSNNGVWPLYTPALGDPLPGNTKACLGVEWAVPAQTDNIIQTDSVTGDISFYVEQSRGNPDFVCPVTKQLVLENETQNPTGPWTPIIDNIQGLLTWKGDGPTFDYSLSAHGLPANTAYSLIYYADPFPGNYPGALIGTGTTDNGGNLAFSGNPNLGIDLPTMPDTNFGIGAKLWLIPSSNYNSGSKSIVSWTPDNSWLFEGNVYINYNDTDN